MQMDDMILVSIDDHMVEPPDMFENHVPAKWRDQAPQGRAQRATASTSGCSRARRPRRRSAWPPRWGGRRRSGASTPPRSPRCGPGCFDIHERVRDMNANGVLASMCFPTMAGLQRPHVQRGPRQGALARDAPGLQRLAHRRVVRHLPGPVHPARRRADVGRRPRGRRGAPPRPRRAAGRSASSRRRTRSACRASSPATGTRCWPALVDDNMVLSLHIGAAWSLITLAPEARDRPPDRRPLAGDDAHRPGPAVRPDAAEVPRPAGRALRGRHRVDPLLPRPRRPPLQEPDVDRQQLRRGQAAVRRVPRARPGLLHHRPVGAEAAPRDRHRHHRLGVRLPPHRHHVARVARAASGRSSRTPAAATRRSTRSRGRTPAGSSTGTRSPTRRRSRRRSGRCARWPPTSTRPACPATSGASATRPPASAGSSPAPRRAQPRWAARATKASSDVGSASEPRLATCSAGGAEQDALDRHLELLARVGARARPARRRSRRGRGAGERRGAEVGGDAARAGRRRARRRSRGRRTAAARPVPPWWSSRCTTRLSCDLRPMASTTV